MKDKVTHSRSGVVTSVRGSIVDVRFDAHLPAILSRMFDVFGRPIDRDPAPGGLEWRLAHRPPPVLARRSTKSEVFESGIKKPKRT